MLGKDRTDGGKEERRRKEVMGKDGWREEGKEETTRKGGRRHLAMGRRQ